MRLNRYLDDNTASNSGAFNVEGGVIEEVAEAYVTLHLLQTVEDVCVQVAH